MSIIINKNKKQFFNFTFYLYNLSNKFDIYKLIYSLYFILKYTIIVF